MSSTQKHRRTTRNLAAPDPFHVWLRRPLDPRYRFVKQRRPRPPRPTRTPANFPRMKDRAGARRRRAAALRGAPGLFAALDAQFRPFAEAFAEVGRAIGARLTAFTRALRPPTIPNQRQYALTVLAEVAEDMRNPPADEGPRIPLPDGLRAPISVPDQVGGNPEGETPS